MPTPCPPYTTANRDLLIHSQWRAILWIIVSLAQLSVAHIGADKDHISHSRLDGCVLLTLPLMGTVPLQEPRPEQKLQVTWDPLLLLPLLYLGGGVKMSGSHVIRWWWKRCLNTVLASVLNHYIKKWYWFLIICFWYVHILFIFSDFFILVVLNWIHILSLSSQICVELPVAL